MLAWAGVAWCGGWIGAPFICNRLQGVFTPVVVIQTTPVMVDISGHSSCQMGSPSGTKPLGHINPIHSATVERSHINTFPFTAMGSNEPVSASLVTVSGRATPLAYGNQEYTAKPLTNAEYYVILITLGKFICNRFF